ncbi:MAG: DUF4230 domain-containing protein [Erysipelotrichaceae bacterium]|nr:DUF4230 domain-containing protein [Erysipelotrichaceae bacterium]
MPEEKELNVSAQAKAVNNEKTKKQDADAAAIKERQAKAAAEAKAAQQQAEAEKKKREEEKKAEAARKEAEEKEAAEKRKKAAAAVGSVAAGAVALGKATKGSFRFLKGILVGLLIGFLAGSYLTGSGLINLGEKVESVKEDVDEMLDEGFLGYTAADFQNAVLGAASEHQELIVMEQPLEITTTLTKAGLANLQIFSKTKTITYYGTGVYTVDLKDMDPAHIKVDNENKFVTISIPHTVLQYINSDLDKTEFEDTEKGLLAFGDLSLTTEQQNELALSVENSMREELTQPERFAQADEFALLKTWEIFQPLISAVSPQYRVIMDFID